MGEILGDCDTEFNLEGALDEIERLRDELAAKDHAIEASKATIIDLSDRLAAKDVEIKRLREAVEWACGTLDGNCDRRYIQAELRRRAKEG